MRPRTVLILALLVGALGAFVWFFERELPSTDERVERARKFLPDLEAEDVTRIEVDGTQRLVLEREPDAAAEDGTELPRAVDRWEIVEPMTARADATEVNALIDDLLGLEKKRTLEGVALEEIGLAEPRFVITLGGDLEVEVRVGSAVPASSDVIVTLGDGPDAHVVGDGFLSRVDRAAGEWRARELFSHDRADIERLSIDRQDDPLVLADRGEEFWVESPFVDRAEEGAVSATLTALVALRAEEFVDDLPEDSDLGLAPPDVAVEVVVTGRDEPVRIAIGGTVPEFEDRRYARVEGKLVQVSDAFAEALALPLEDWRSLEWSSFEVFEIDRVEVTGEGKDLVLERIDGDWQRDGEAIEFATASDFLYGVTGVKADRIDDGVPAGQPDLQIEIFGADGRSESLGLWKAAQEGRRASVSGRDVTFWLQPETLDPALRRLADVESAEPVVSQPDDAMEEPGDDSANE